MHDRYVVRLGRLELPRPKALEPKSSASANSATGASGGYLTVACGFVKVPARARLTHTTAHGPGSVHSRNRARPTPSSRSQLHPTHCPQPHTPATPTPKTPDLPSE